MPPEAAPAGLLLASAAVGMGTPHLFHPLTDGLSCLGGRRESVGDVAEVARVAALRDMAPILAALVGLMLFLRGLEMRWPMPRRRRDRPAWLTGLATAPGFGGPREAVDLARSVILVELPCRPHRRREGQPLLACHRTATRPG